MSEHVSERFYGFEEDVGENSTGLQVLKCGPKGLKLIHNGFIYHKDKQADRKFYWQCSLRREQPKENKCPGRARTEKNTNGQHFLLATTSHNHLPDALSADSAKYRASLKRKANEGTENPEKIMRFCAPQFPVEVQTTISRVAQRKVCQRQRTNASLPKDPEDYAVIDAEFTKTCDGREFLLANCKVNDSRLLIFSTVDNLTRLSQSEVIILDGTFSSAPTDFRQIYTIHGSIGNGLGRKFVPFVHILLPDKAEGTYKKALKLVKKRCTDHNIELDPAVILTDFEIAEMNAVKIVFPDSALFGCFFHLTKSWYKKIQQLGLNGQYAKNTKLQLVFWQAQALAFLDIQEVPQGLAAIKESAPKVMEPFLDYISDYYVMGRRKKTDSTKRSKPRFPVEIWNVRENVIKNIPRTSNAIEGFHNKFNSLLKGGSQMKFYAIIKAFRQEEISTTAEYMRYIKGDLQTDRRSKILKKKEERLKRLIEERSVSNREVTLFDHIQGLALALHGK